MELFYSPSSHLVGGPSNCSFVTAYGTATTITVSSLPAVVSALSASNIVIIDQLNASGVLVRRFNRKVDPILVSGTTISVTNAAFQSTDSFIVYTNIPRESANEFPASSAASDNYANPTTTDVKSFGMVWDRVGSNWDRLQNNAFMSRGMATHSSPNDGTATYTSSTTITCAGFPFTVDNTTCRVLGIAYKPTGGLWTILESGKQGVSLDASSNVITVTGAGTPFASGDTYEVLIRYQQKGFNAANNANNSTETSPLDQKYNEVEWQDTTNIAAATNYYPSADGFVVDGYTLWSVQEVDSGGVTVTFEVTNDDASSPDWVDITPAAYNAATNAAGSASYIDATALLVFEGIPAKKFRVKKVTSDASNGVQTHTKFQVLG